MSVLEGNKVLHILSQIGNRFIDKLDMRRSAQSRRLGTANDALTVDDECVPSFLSENRECERSCSEV